MTSLWNKLSEKETIWLTFWLTIAETICFGLVMWWWEFTVIDEMFEAEEIATHIGNMTLQQRNVHIWMTATLDVLYPFTYSSFFLGVAIRAFKGHWLAILPTLLCVPTDLTEGYAQVMLLSGHKDFMAIKTTATPLKLLLFGTALIITILGAARLWLEPARGTGKKQS
ncbi:expressed unknown protein [Seminavis robusta]|uniref:Uncharacterized protein n=1 Tax=Seminavis robusta TaxID=568900 RepID=A0A9N8DSL9_9STRA|nr:expressed unknown protein [Seminavis robusta]|eukprot:Sro326_g118010.1 n/a (168) ;mRNA; r:17019-17522